MGPLKDTIVCITGASSGIGAACAEAFAGEGCALLLSARRGDRLAEIAGRLRGEHGCRVHTAVLDVRSRTAVEQYVASLPPEWSDIGILVNNAGLSRGLDKLHEGSVEDWEEMLDTNVKGLLYVTRALLPGMVRRKKGHVVNIGSVAGHEVYPNGNVYCASKHAVDAITKGLRMDLLGTGVRVTTVDPGLVETEFSEVRFHGDKKRAASVYTGMQPLTAEDIAEIVLFCTMRPSHVDISEVIVMPTDQASVHHVFRKP
jgi:3-hydroxy acid dehydrogenase/malonic semialdehyde reductase